MAHDIGSGRSRRRPRRPGCDHESGETASDLVVRIVLVGGCEKQARVVEALRPPADVALRAIHPAMNSRWNRQLRQVKNAARNADAIVMTTDVRTEFGRELKRWARKHDIPLVVRHGRGQRAIEALIVEARDRALRKRSGAGT